MTFDIQAMVAILPKALLGWAGVFVVIGILVLVVSLLNRLTRHEDKNT